MDFTFDETQQAVRDLARTIMTDLVTAERISQTEKSAARFDRALWEALADADLLALALPEDVGGSGLSVLETCLVLQEWGRHVAPIPLLATTVLGALPIAKFGSERQRRQLLPEVAAGRLVLTGAIEDGYGTDGRSCRTIARQDSDGTWRLDGVKSGVPWALVAERILVTAEVGETTSGFLIDPSDAGVTLEPVETTHREIQGHLTLDGVRVAPDDVLGGAPAGADVADWILQRALAGLCATGIGVIEEALRITAEYISGREVFGFPVATYQGPALRIADGYIDASCAWVTTWSAIWKLSQELPHETDLAVAKFWIADAGQRVLHTAQHLHGGIGIDVDYPLHRYFLWAKACELMLGGAMHQAIRIGRVDAQQGESSVR